MGDLPEIAAIERRAWPGTGAMQARPEKLAVRIEHGCLLVTRDGEGKICGFVSAFRPRWARLDALTRLEHDAPPMRPADPGERWARARALARLPVDWGAATDDGWIGRGVDHDPQGEVLFGIGVTTDPLAQGRGVATQCLCDALARARADGVRLFVAYGRLPHYGADRPATLDRHLRRHLPGHANAPFDPGLRLHWRLGAQPMGRDGRSVGFLGIPSAMPEDTASRGCGFLVYNRLTTT